LGDTAARRLVLQRRYIEDIGSVVALAAMQHASDGAEEIVRFRFIDPLATGMSIWMPVGRRSG